MTKMIPVRNRLLLLCALLAGCATFGTEERASSNQTIFTMGAETRDGKVWIQARDYLVSQGTKIAGLLDHKRKSEDWKERLFADVISLYQNYPEMTQRWYAKLIPPDALYGMALKCIARHDEQLPWPPKAMNSDDLIPPAIIAECILFEESPLKGLPNLHYTMDPQACALMYCVINMPSIPLETLWEPRGDFRREKILEEILYRAGKDREDVRSFALGKIDAFVRHLVSNGYVLEQWDDHVVAAARALSRLQDEKLVPMAKAALSTKVYARNYGRPKQWIEEWISCASHYNDPKLMHLAFEHLILSAQTRRFDNGNHPSYNTIRDALININGPLANIIGDFFRERHSIVGKMATDALLAHRRELGGKESHIAILREDVFFYPNGSGLNELRNLTGESIVPWVTTADGYIVYPHPSFPLFGDAPDELENWISVLGSLGDPDIVPFIIRHIDAIAASLNSIWPIEQRKGDKEQLYSQLYREKSDPASQTFWKISALLLAGDEAFVALAKLKTVEAVATLRKYSADPAWATQIRALLMGIEGNIDALRAEVGAEDHATAESASLALYVHHDRNGLNGLLRAAARRNGDRHLFWRTKALAMDNAREEVTKLPSDDFRLNVLKEAILFALDHPKEYRDVRESMSNAASGVSMHHVITVNLLRDAGRDLVSGSAQNEEKSARIDIDRIALLEEQCLFGQGVIQRGIAAYALKQLRQKRSIPVLHASFNMGTLGGTNPAVEAICAFGDEGKKIAEQAPVLIPGEADTGLSMTMHRSGTVVMAEMGDIRGVDQIIDGLNTIFADTKMEGRPYRASIYISAARAYRDKRLIPVLIKIAKMDAGMGRDISRTAIAALSFYPGLEIETLLLDIVRGGETENRDALLHWNVYSPQERPELVASLCRHWREKTSGEFLRMAESENPTVRMFALAALGELSFAPSPPYPGKEVWPRDAEFADINNRQSKAIRDQAMPIFLHALRDQKPEVKNKAAWGLVIYAYGGARDGISFAKDAVEPLNGYLASVSSGFPELYEFLGRYGNAHSGNILLDILSNQRPIHRCDTSLIHAVMTLRPKGSARMLTDIIRSHMTCGDTRFRGCGSLSYLKSFGEEGRYSLCLLLKEATHPDYLSAICRELALGNFTDVETDVENALRRTLNLDWKEIRFDPDRSDESPAVSYARHCRSQLESLSLLNRKIARDYYQEIIGNEKYPKEVRESVITLQLR